MAVDSEDLGVATDIGDLIVVEGREKEIGPSYSALAVHWCMDGDTNLV